MLWSERTLENVKPPCPLLGRAEISQDKWGKPRMLWKPPFSGWRTWTTPIWISLPWVLPAACPTPDFKRAASWGAGETHQENSDHLTNLRRLAASPSPPCWVSISLKSSPSSLTQSFQNPADSEVPLWFQGLCLKPFSAALGSFLTTLTPLPCFVLNKWKQSVLQPKKKKRKKGRKSLGITAL